MSVEVLKTAAERQLADQFEAAKTQLPGVAVIADARQAAFDHFSAVGLPHRRVEEYKFSDVRARMSEAFAPAQPPASSASDAAAVDAAIASALGPIATMEATRIVLIDGVYAAELSAPGSDTLIVKPLSEALADDCFAQAHATLDARADADPTVALNTAFMRDGAALVVLAAQSVPVHIVNVETAASEVSVTTRHVVAVQPGAHVTLIESHVSLGTAATQQNATTHIGVGDGARVEHVKILTGHATAAHKTTHLGNWVVHLAGEADYRGFQMTAGGAFTRNQVFLRFDGPHASAHINGAFLLADTQHCDSTLYVDHAVPNCQSREFFKGVLADNARGVFQGKVMVHQTAQKTDGQQMSQALLLSPNAEFDAKPELEIFADDVACGHGATTGEIDEDQLFYLRARGIPDHEARRLLVQAFVSEVFDGVADETIAAGLNEIAERWMAKTLSREMLERTAA